MKLKTNITIYYEILILLTCILFTTPVFAGSKAVLAGIDGKQHSISDYTGKGTWTLVNIWAVHCPPCREEMPDLVLLNDRYHKTLVSVVGIAVGFPDGGYPDKKEVHEFLQEFMVDFPILLGNENIASKLGADSLEGLPTSLMYTPDGKLIAEQTGAINQQIVLDFIKNYNEKHKSEKNMKKK